MTSPPEPPPVPPPGTEGHDAVPGPLERVARAWSLPAPPAWLRTSLAAEFRRDHGQAGPARVAELDCIHDSRRDHVAGVRAATAKGTTSDAGDFTVAWRAEPGDVVVDGVVRDDGLVDLHGLVLLLGGTRQAFRLRMEVVGDEATRAAVVDVVDVVDGDDGGRFGVTALPPRHYRFELDGGDVVLVGELDLRSVP